jgi:hypothetical protein
MQARDIVEAPGAIDSNVHWHWMNRLPASRTNDSCFVILRRGLRHLINV